MELYSEQDRSRTQSKVRALSVMAGVMLAAIIVLAYVFLGPVRNQTALMAVLVVGGAVFYYVFVVKVLPWIRYALFQRDIQRGRYHEMDCRFVSVSDSTRMSDGVEFRDFVVSLEAEDSEDEEERLNNQRLLLWDADKPVPEIRPGQNLHVRTFGNYVTVLNLQ
ncbi:MAG: hypothetical protein IJJ23_00330 [Clostridia bacterium]|nr:hypothetical protein [Clostridia bacterium]